MGKIRSRLFGSGEAGNPSSRDYTPYGTDGTPLPYMNNGQGRHYFGEKGPTPAPEVSPEPRMELRGTTSEGFTSALPAAPGGTDRVQAGNFDDWPGLGTRTTDQQRLQRLRTPMPPAQSIPRAVVPIPPDEGQRLNNLRLPPIQTNNRPSARATIPPPLPPPAPNVTTGGEIEVDGRMVPYVTAPGMPAPRMHQPDLPSVDSTGQPVVNEPQQPRRTTPRRRRRQGPPSRR